MKILTIVMLFLILLPISSASVTREFTWNGNTYTQSFTIPVDSTDRNVTITLTPSPFSDYDIPGYYVTESLPSEITLYNTNADWSDLTDRTLNLLKFMPPSDKPAITYTVRLDKERKYDFFGTYKNENKFSGDIPTQTITVEGKPLINFSNIWEPDKTEPTVPVISVSDDDSKVIPINASQKQQSDNTIIPIIAVLLIVNGILGYLIYKKYYTKKPVQEVQKPKRDEIEIINSIRTSFRKLLKFPPLEKEQPVPLKPQQKPQEVFEIIGDDDEPIVDISSVEQELRKITLQKIALLKMIRTMNLDKFKETKDETIKDQLMNKVLGLDKEIGELQRKL